MLMLTIHHGVFSGILCCQDSIHIIMNSEGTPCGEAYVKFSNAEDSKAAYLFGQYQIL